MSAADLTARRLANQRLGTAGRGAPLDVVCQLGAMQAQDYGQALWAIGARTPGSARADVVAAIEAGEILRTWPMRGTIHFVPARDAAWMLQLGAARMLAGARTRQDQLALTGDDVHKAHDLLRTALSGTRLSRPKIMEMFEAAGLSTAGQRGYHLLWHAANSGLICIGPMEGKQQTFVLLAEWVPDPAHLSPDDALTELARRYFTGHGPATAADFSWWAGLTLTMARRGLAAAAPDLSTYTDDGIEYATAKRPARPATPGPLLLPGFDEYLLGYKDRTAMLARQHELKIAPGRNGVFFPMMVLDGQIVGTWKRTETVRSVAIEFAPFEDVSSGEFAEQAERYAAYLELPLGRVSVSAAGVQS